MNPISLNIPESEYDNMLLSGRLSAEAEGLLARELNKWPSVAVFGREKTGQVMERILGERFAGYTDTRDLALNPALVADAVVLATGPAHYQEVLATLKKAGLGGMPTILPFTTEQELDIRLIIESQPRSGTHYTLKNMLKRGDLGFASAFEERDSKVTPDGLVSYRPGDHPGGYVAKAHFAKNLHFPAYRFVPVMFLVSYFFDTYCSWGKLLIKAKDENDYRLLSHSTEWSILKGHFSLHCKWLDYIRDKFLVRYEDYFTDFEKTVRRIEGFCGLTLPDFEPPRPNPERCYWSGDYAARMDQEVYATLRETFSPYIERYYPEKLPLPENI